MLTLDYLKDLSDKVFNTPILDGVFFNQTIDMAIKTGQFKKCKIITGFDSNEFALFLYTNEIINEANDYGFFGFNFEQFTS